MKDKRIISCSFIGLAAVHVISLHNTYGSGLPSTIVEWLGEIFVLALVLAAAHFYTKGY